MVDRNSRSICRILLVDDSTACWQLTRIVLEKAGYTVVVAEDGKQALDAFGRATFDLILMDIEMPGMDGQMAARAIRFLESGQVDRVVNETVCATRHRRIPIIAMSGYPETELRTTHFEKDFDDFLSKPSTRGETLAMVSKWIAGQQEPAEPRFRNSPEKNIARNDNPMDIDRATQEFEGNRSLLMDVLSGFQNKVIDQIGIIRQAVLEGNVRKVQKEAHAIQGGAAHLTAHPLAEMASRLEELGKSGALEGGIGMVDDLEREFCRLQDYLRNA